MQAYSDPRRAEEPPALPDVELFRFTELEANYNLQNLDHANENTLTEPGWYYWYCQPGCLPDSGPIGPFATEAECRRDFESDCEVGQ